MALNISNVIRSIPVQPGGMCSSLVMSYLTLRTHCGKVQLKYVFIVLQSHRRAHSNAFWRAVIYPGCMSGP